MKSAFIAPRRVGVSTVGVNCICACASRKGICWQEWAVELVPFRREIDHFEREIGKMLLLRG